MFIVQYKQGPVSIGMQANNIELSSVTLDDNCANLSACQIENFKIKKLGSVFFAEWLHGTNHRFPEGCFSGATTYHSKLLLFKYCNNSNWNTIIIQINQILHHISGRLPTLDWCWLFIVTSPHCHTRAEPSNPWWDKCKLKYTMKLKKLCTMY